MSDQFDQAIVGGLDFGDAIAAAQYLADHPRCYTHQWVWRHYPGYTPAT
ncbi:MAG TPA: hypothetical protein VEB59_03065 [Gemmatimonadales bacterium]|nr:hypothetical protein [Gemmatimonadales bacterium]